MGGAGRDMDARAGQGRGRARRAGPRAGRGREGFAPTHAALPDAPSSPCTEASCPIIGSFANASWPQTQAGQIGQGTCFNGFEGNPTRVCDNNGVWQGVSNPCTPTVPNCLASTYNAATWPQTAPGSWHLPYPGWQPTRYEEKARAEGRAVSFYFTFIRI